MNINMLSEQAGEFKTALWLTWEKQVRNRNLSARMNSQLEEITIAGSRSRRYLISIYMSVKLLWRWRKKAVVVQNPSIVLSLLAVLLKPVLRYQLTVDAHNAGIYPPGALLPHLIKFIVKHSDFTIVTNDNLANQVQLLGGTAIVLPDPLPPDFDNVTATPGSSNEPSVLFICSWAADEPYFEVMRAAEQLSNIRFWITGSSKGKEKGFNKALPTNVVLTGYVPDHEYHNLILSADIIIDLTTREDCLVCGAYESVAACKPFVLSDSAALKSYFYRGGVHTANNAEAIAAGIQAIYTDYERYKNEVTRFKSTLEQSWQAQLDTAMQRMSFSR